MFSAHFVRVPSEHFVRVSSAHLTAANGFLAALGAAFRLFLRVFGGNEWSVWRPRTRWAPWSESEALPQGRLNKDSLAGESHHGAHLRVRCSADRRQKPALAIKSWAVQHFSSRLPPRLAVFLSGVTLKA